MAGGIGTGYGALDFLLAGGGGSNSLFGASPYSTSPTGGLPFNMFGGNFGGFGGGLNTSAYSEPGYSTSVTTGTQAGSGQLASDQTHASSQSAAAVTDGRTENNLFSNQRDTQKVNVFLDPQIGPGRSGSNMPIGGFLSDLVSVNAGGGVADTNVSNNQDIGLDQSAHAEEGGTAINNAYQIQNNVQIVNLYLDLNLQLPGFPQNPWSPSPWMPGGVFPNYQTSGPVQQPGLGWGATSNPYGSSPYPTGAPGATQPAPQYDPAHIQPFKNFTYATNDLDYDSRRALRETIKDYGRFFDENGSRALGRVFTTLAGTVGTGDDIDRAERRFLRFEDAVSDLDQDERLFLFESLNALKDEVPTVVQADPAVVDDIQFSLEDLAIALAGDDYADYGLGDTGAVNPAGSSAAA